VAVEKKRVLVVDDDPELLQLVRVLLLRAGVEVLTAVDAFAAEEEMVSSGLPDLLILDIMLPDKSGIEFLREMRSEHVYDSVPVMILSALIDPEQRQIAREAGADKYLTKPYVAGNLISTGQEMLRDGRSLAS
jgi:two-component system, OmpR family, phosphate regulon response regulator PhoB